MHRCPAPAARSFALTHNLLFPLSLSRRRSRHNGNKVCNLEKGVRARFSLLCLSSYVYVGMDVLKITPRKGAAAAAAVGIYHYTRCISCQDTEKYTADRPTDERERSDIEVPIDCMHTLYWGNDAFRGLEPEPNLVSSCNTTRNLENKLPLCSIRRGNFVLLPTRD